MDIRSEREKEQYNQGLKRDLYNKILRHSRGYNHDDKVKLAKTIMLRGEGGIVLELGSESWTWWLEDFEIYPLEVHCINISEVEMGKGIRHSETSKNKPIFHLMDAHKLDFDNSSFDLVFGTGILHHLDLDVSLMEINRVLKKDGVFIFLEPLNINPVSKLIRFLTPKARTVDERPFGFKEIALLRKHFDIEIHAFEFFSVPFSVLSGFIFRKAENPITYASNRLDKMLQIIFPPIRYFYRSMIVVGKKKSDCD